MAKPQYAAIVNHADWCHPRVLVRDTEDDADDAGTRLLLKLTAECRDYDEHPDDEDWVAVCLSEDWALETGIVVE